MGIQTMKKEVEVCKESMEVFEALEGLVKSIKEKKDVAVIIAESLPKVMVAVEGFDKLDDEVKNEHFYETAGLGGASIVKALVFKKAE